MVNDLKSIWLPDISLETCGSIASLIVGKDNPPRWLIDHFRRWIPSHAIAQNSDQLQPTRALLLQRMKAIVDAAGTLAALIADTPTREFLEMESFGQLDETLCHCVLGDLSKRAEAASAHRLIAGMDGKARPGRSKAMPPDSLPAKEFCAAMIAEAWKYVSGKEPSARNDAASKAAQALWEAAGGGSKDSWGSTRRARWRRYFEAAGEPRAASMRQEVRRHLSESERGPLASVE